MVSLQTMRGYHGIWRWNIERDSATRLVKAWSAISASEMPDSRKVRLANVAWAAGAFDRAYCVLLDDIVRAERAKNVGVPAAMKFLSGPYEHSVDYLLGMGLWMDLGDVLVAYRTIAGRLARLKRHGGRNWSADEIEREVRVLQGRTLTQLGPKPVTLLADAILHHTWDPSEAMTQGFTLHWKGSDPARLDLAEGDLRGALDTLVEDTLQQVDDFVSTALHR